MGWYIFKNKNSLTLVSKSKDGEYLTNILRKWEYEVIRGSSSKDGKNALDNIIKSTDKFKTIVLTPDGPRGPVKIIKNGLFKISLTTGFEIIAVKPEYNKYFTLNKSWDKFEIPFPFTSCSVRFSNPILYDNLIEGDKFEEFKDSISILM